MNRKQYRAIVNCMAYHDMAVILEDHIPNDKNKWVEKWSKKICLQLGTDTANPKAVRHIVACAYENAAP